MGASWQATAHVFIEADQDLLGDRHSTSRLAGRKPHLPCAVNPELVLGIMLNFEMITAATKMDSSQSSIMDSDTRCLVESGSFCSRY